MTTPYFPLVKGETTSVSPNVESLMDQMNDGTVYVPEYQRDSSQWPNEKRSLFIESLLNNFTIPPCIVCPENDQASGREKKQIVDGQQRLTTVRDFMGNKFSLSHESDVEYSPNLGPLIHGKKFAELGEELQKQIRRYTINLIVLPKDLGNDKGLRLEIFRRINEAGVPLSGQDLRLATFSASKRVYFIRIAGIFDPTREGSQRMLKYSSEQFELPYPWQVNASWCDWWNEKDLAVGQAASEMFLNFVIALDRAKLATLLASNAQTQRLGIKFDKTKESALDLYCAQLELEDRDEKAPRILSSFESIVEWFKSFEIWFRALKEAKVPKLPLGSGSKTAYFIAAAKSVWGSPNDVSEAQWEAIQFFLTKGPSEIKERLKCNYSISKGRWTTHEQQIEDVANICQIIARMK